MSTQLWSTHVTNLACWRGPAASRRWLSLFVGVTLISSGVSVAVRVNGRPQDLVLDRADLHTSAVETCRLRLQAFAGEGKLDRDAELIARVRGVAARIIAQAILLGSPNGERFGRYASSDASLANAAKAYARVPPALLNLASQNTHAAFVETSVLRDQPDHVACMAMTIAALGCLRPCRQVVANQGH